MDEEGIKSITSEVLLKIKPQKEMVDELESVVSKILQSVDIAASDLKVEAYGKLVGSVARGTWRSGEKDIDIFIMLPSSMSREELEEVGLSIAKICATDFEERYAEHPYIRAKIEGYDIDLVPAFSVDEASKIKSAVDRTPFHNDYIKGRIDGLADEVILLKQFMSGAGVYGAELKVQGFSGYLCELLVIKYGSFFEVLKAASDWKLGQIINMEEIGTYNSKDPFVFIDPVDPNRNVAAAVSLQSYSRFIDASRSFLDGPDLAYFFSEPVSPITKKELTDLLKERGTELITIDFVIPDLIDDILFPQLYKAEKAIIRLMNRHDFRVFSSDVWAGAGRAIILFEMEVGRLPNIKKVIGPPVTFRGRVENFREKHVPNPTFIEDGIYVARVPRRYTNVTDLLENELGSCSLGKNISNSLDGCKILKDEEIYSSELGIFIKEFLK
ncbi:MAG: CCA tRNA nucleotidyltransferase [Halobacteriota archaeon]|nr:CCA tRNA nucleotidyltransferase [Halobacteriota archaeon]